VRLSYFLMALVLGRPGLRAHFLQHGAYDWSGCLRWLVLHGVREMQLWPFLSESFVRELRAPSLLVEGKHLSPLQAIVMAERPDVLAAFRNQASPEDFAAFFTEWFLRRGVADYEHAWLMSTDEVAYKVRNDPGGGWTGTAATRAAEAEAQAPDPESFPNSVPDPPTPASLARANGRAQYRMYGRHYPCAFLDMSDPNTAISAVMTGEARPALRNGLELLSSFVELRLPDGRDSTAIIKLELAVPEPLRHEISVRLRVRDGLGPVRFERRLSAEAVSAGPLIIPVILRDLTPRLEIAFALGGRPPQGGRDIALTFAVLRSLQVWQVIAEAASAAALPAEAA
jgi:hypothetical protein